MIRRLYIREATPDPGKRAMTNIVKRGVEASPPAEKQWGDALLKAVDTFDVQVRDVAAGKKAPAAGKKPVNPARPTPKPEPTADPGLDDPWFQDDGPELGAAGAAPKGQKVKGPSAEPKPAQGDDEFPSFAGSQAFQSQNSPTVGAGSSDDDDGDVQPFNPHLYGGGSSWEDVPDWMRDPGKMPTPGDGPKHRSIPVPSSKGPTPSGTGPSPVGKPWSERDADRVTGTRRPGMLSRIFGRKAK